MSSKETATTHSAELDVRQIPIGDLKPSPTNPRRVKDAKADDELAASVKQFGVLQPILARSLAKGGFEVIAGERRFRAAKAAELATIPVRILELADDQVLEVQIIENLQRKDIHPLDEADGFGALLEHGYEVEKIADKVGKSAAYVYQRLGLRKITKKARALYEDGKLVLAHALTLGRLQAKDQDALLQSLDWEIKNGTLTVSRLQRWINENVLRDLHGAPWKKDDAELLPTAGACSACPKRSGAVPGLFDDIAKKDTCSDPSCFAEKMAAHLARTKKDLEAKGEKVVEVSEYYGGLSKKGAVTANNWRPAKKGEKGAVQAVVVEGGGIGHVKSVVLQKDSTRAHLSDDGSNWKAQQKARDAKRAAARKRIDALVVAVLAKVPSTLSAEDLRVVALGSWRRTWNDFQKRIAKRRGWELEKSQGVERAGEREIAKLAAGALAGLVVEIALANIETGYGESSGPQASLLAMAKRYGVNAAAAMKEATSAPKSPKKAPPKLAPKRKAVAAKTSKPTAKPKKAPAKRKAA